MIRDKSTEAGCFPPDRSAAAASWVGIIVAIKNVPVTAGHDDVLALPSACRRTRTAGMIRLRLP